MERIFLLQLGDDANKRCVQMRVVVDGDDDAVKFAERLSRFWRMNLLLDARLLTRRLCGKFRVFFVWTRRFSNKIWREILETSK